MAKRKNPLWKVIATDALGVICLMLVPFLGPLPGPGGIPLILAGFGFLAVNHDWADDAIHFVKRNSEDFLSYFFPNKTLIKWAWDIFAVTALLFGLWMNLTLEWWLLKGLSYPVMAGGSTLFMLNRKRLDWLDSQVKKFGKR